FHGLRIRLIIRDRRLQLGIPVDEAFAAIDEAVPEQVEKGLAHGAGADRIEREARALPVTRRAQLAKLAEDAFLVAFLPAPDALDQLLAAEIVARFLLGLGNQLFDRGLRGDAGMIGAGDPERVEPLHAPPA